MPKMEVRNGVAVLTCPHCGHTLTEQFDRGAVACGACDVSWSVVSILRAVQELTNLLLAELSLKGDGGHVQPRSGLCPVPAIAG